MEHTVGVSVIIPLVVQRRGSIVLQKLCSEKAYERQNQWLCPLFQLSQKARGSIVLEGIRLPLCSILSVVSLHYAQKRWEA